MYAEMAGEEDKKMAESWKGDADGILIFVRLIMIHANWGANSYCIIDRFVLRGRRYLDRGINSGPSAELTRHRRILSR